MRNSALHIGIITALDSPGQFSFFHQLFTYPSDVPLFRDILLKPIVKWVSLQTTQRSSIIVMVSLAATDAEVAYFCGFIIYCLFSLPGFSFTLCTSQISHFPDRSILNSPNTPFWYFCTIRIVLGFLFFICKHIAHIYNDNELQQRCLFV